MVMQIKHLVLLLIGWQAIKLAIKIINTARKMLDWVEDFC